MNTVLALALKDIRLQTRDYFGLFWIVVFPLLYALFFGAVFSSSGSQDDRKLPVAIIDEEQSSGSKAFADRLKNSPALVVELASLEKAREAVLKGRRAAYILIKGGFGDGGFDFDSAGKRLELGIDPVRKAEAGMLKGIIMEAVFADMQTIFSDPAKGREMAHKALAELEKQVELDPILKTSITLFLGSLDRLLQNVPKGKEGERKSGFGYVDLKEHSISRHREGPTNSFEVTFPQSILWGLMGCVASFSISIVIERNQGTFLRLRTSPLTWTQVLAGKGLACLLTSIIVIVSLLMAASILFGVRLGDPLLLALAIGSTAICFTGLMMLFSTLGKTEGGVAGAGWGIMMPMAMLGGGMVPLLVMPGWMQSASNFSPVKWGIYALEGAVWRGFTLTEMLLPCAILLSVGVVGYSLGVWKLRSE